MTKRRKVGSWLVVLVVVALVASFVLLRGRRGRVAWPSAVASAACGPSSCQKLSCAVGSHPRVDSDRCCHECEPDAPIVPGHDRCAKEKCGACADGTHAELVEGQCCPRCVQLDEAACKTGRELYQARRAIAEDELRRCTSDDDCMVASFGDACSASCPQPLNKRELGGVVSRLREEAEVYCLPCAPPTFACQYPDATEAHCVKGRCEFRTVAEKVKMD